MSLLLLLLVLLEPLMEAWFWVGTEADFDVGFAGFGVGQVGEKGVGVSGRETDWAREWCRLGLGGDIVVVGKL